MADEARRSVEARLVQLDREVAEVASEVKDVWNQLLSCTDPGKEAKLQKIYDNLVAKEKELLHERSNLERQLTGLESALAPLLQELRVGQQQLLHRVEQQQQQLLDAEYLIPPHKMNLVRQSVFLVKAGQIAGAPGLGVGVFFSERMAVTANHNLPGELCAGQQVFAICDGSPLILNVERREPDLDFALLSCSEQHAYLQVFRGDAQSLVSRKVALCAFQLGTAEHLPEFHVETLGVMDASVVKVSMLKHHLVLRSETWPGDSGAAVVLHDGQLVGIHLDGVNALRDRFELQQGTDADERLTVLEASLADAALSVASGCIALMATTFAP